MKNWTTRVVLCVFAACLAQSVQAEVKRSGTVSGKPTFYMGFTADTSHALLANSIAAVMVVNDKGFLQLNAAMALTPPAPSVTFGVGGAYKHAIVGDAWKGFHVGGGLALGISPASAFGINLNLLTGLHFEIVESVLIILDGGLLMNIATTGPTFGMNLGAANSFGAATIVMSL